MKRSTKALFWGVAAFGCIGALAMLFLMRRKGISFIAVLAFVTYVWAIGCVALMARFPKNMPAWGFWWIPKWGYRDFQERFVHASQRRQSRETRDALRVCLVCGLGGVGYGLFGWTGCLLFGCAAVAIVLLSRFVK